jgi:hypothetical protein
MKTSFLSFVALMTCAFAPLVAAEPTDRTVAAHAGKLDQWFTVEEAAKIAGKPVDAAQVQYQKIEKRPYTEVVDYSWKGERKRMTTGALKMEIPIPDSIKVGWLRKDTLDQLKALREMTEAEDLAGVGEYAFMVKSDEQYIIFKNGIRFSIWINISNDPKVNHAKALEIANLLLKKI